MKKIIIVSYTRFAAEIHRKTLTSIFKDAIQVDILCLDNTHSQPVDADLAILVATELVYFAKKHLKSNSQMVLADYSIPQTSLNHIRDLTKRGRVSLVCENRKVAGNRQQLLLRLGIDENMLDIWIPGMPSTNLHTGIVVFGNNCCFKTEGKDIVQIPGRYLSIDVLVKVAASLDMFDSIFSDNFQSYRDFICVNSYLYPCIISNIDYRSLIGDENIKSGLVIFDSNFKALYCDHYIESITGISCMNIIGKKIWNYFDFLSEFKREEPHDTIDKLITFNGRKYVAQLNFLTQHKNVVGYLNISDYIHQTQREDHLRKQAFNKSNVAKYTFENIIGGNKIAECKKIAQRMANVNSSVLITGPTGVGKEVFAQSIHNASKRKNFPFIAVNCAAIVESLLESELFGYDSGAFTGAKKEGKRGMFEMAHKGTLFLDEISELPMHLQSKLLRVLQEREITHVGGYNVIPIDVRIIAATNKDLTQMIHQGTFRSDFYYRLNVLPLAIPPLSERREDILPLLEHFLRTANENITLSPAAQNRILQYSFKGNVRELQNCAEYLVSLGTDYIEESALPFYILEEVDHTYIISRAAVQSDCSLSVDPSLVDKIKLAVLRSIWEINQLGIGAGRRSIKTYLEKNETFLSETQVRKTLVKLSDWQLITIGRGRAGVQIRPAGIKLINYLSTNSQ